MEKKRQLIYLDNNATTQIDKRVLAGMMPYLTDNFANANSSHQFGAEAYEAVKNARKQVADLIGALPSEIIFTSGATESINIAIKGVAENYGGKGNHVITVTTEHNAVLDTCRYLETRGFEVTYLSVEKDGIINLDKLISALHRDTILVTVMFGNNETGVLQPIKEIAELAHKAGAIFMSDCTQVVGKMPVNVNALGMDILCFSGHKIYAPKGIGALYVKQIPNRIKIPALFHGGGHERGIRSGTLNVPGIVGMGLACELAGKEMKKNSEHICALRNFLEGELLKIPGTFINGSRDQRLYNVTNIRFENTNSEALIIGLANLPDNLPLIAVSNGSACTSASIEPSHVLTAMGLGEPAAFSSIRFSLGKYNTKKDMDITTEAVKSVVHQLRAMIN